MQIMRHGGRDIVPRWRCSGGSGDEPFGRTEDSDAQWFLECGMRNGSDGGCCCGCGRQLG